MALVDDAHIARLLLQALRAVQVSYLDRLSGRGYPGVRPGHIPVFAGLDPAGTRVTDLAERGGMTRQMMGRLVRELEQLGYLATRADPADQRAVIVSLTDRGRALGDAAAEIIAELERQYADGLGDPDLVRLKSDLATIIASAPPPGGGASPSA
jgi:DNA-binding MarR family transcriptional regulator